MGTFKWMVQKLENISRTMLSTNALQSTISINNIHISLFNKMVHKAVLHYIAKQTTQWLPI